jgi:hypothetical protein
MRYTICMIENIEDCLEHLAGMRESSVKFTIEQTDFTIVNSIARQVFKGTALTDRQFALMQEKLVAYKAQFVEAGVENLEDLLQRTRQPLRQIDRSKYIKCQDNTIVIRFPFNKTDICYIHEFAGTAEGYHHQKGTHIHYFEYDERNVLNLLDRFTKKDFVIDEELIEVYTAAKAIHSSPQEYLSGIVNNKLVNINPALDTVIQHEVGKLCNSTFAKFIDRRFRYALDYVELPSASTSLAHSIISRKEVTYNSRPSAESTSDILTALWDLDRFPLLVVLDAANAEEQLHELANYYRDMINPEEQSVLFRLDDAEAGFNQLVKDRKLNNWVDSTTKVVYISKSKLPKILVNNEWKPSAAFSYDSKVDRFVDSYVSFNCDLIVYREETTSPFRKYSRIYG